jgi:hypothetical protein
MADFNIVNSGLITSDNLLQIQSYLDDKRDGAKIITRPIAGTKISVGSTLFGSDCADFDVDLHNIPDAVKDNIFSENFDPIYVRSLFGLDGKFNYSEKLTQYRQFAESSDFSLSQSIVQKTGLCGQLAIIMKLRNDYFGRENALIHGFKPIIMDTHVEYEPHTWNLIKQPDGCFATYDLSTSLCNPQTHYAFTPLDVWTGTRAGDDFSFEYLLGSPIPEYEERAQFLKQH